jgi:hypothetical protein
MFQTNVLETTETHVLCSITFSSENRAVYEIMCEIWHRQADRQATDDSIIRRMCVACWIIRLETRTHSVNI